MSIFSLNAKAQYYFDLFYVLIQKEFKVRYSGSFFGYIWSIVNPLVQGLVFFVAFGIFMRFPHENYLLLLLSALYPWQWVSNSLSHAPKIYLSCPALVKKVYFPRYMAPLACCFQDMIHLCLSIPVFLVFALFHGITLSWILLAQVPVLLVISYVTIASCSVILACCNAYVRDLENVLPSLLQILFFLTPVIYPLSIVPENIRFLLYANPFFAMISLWRSVLLEQVFLWDMFFMASVIAGAFFCFARYTYNKLSWKLAELL